jgi:autotransporter-associated beta strand protein
MKLFFKKNLLCSLAVVSGSILFMGASQAQTWTNGGTTDNWSDSGNWTPNVPAGSNNNTAGFNTGITFNSLTTAPITSVVDSPGSTSWDIRGLTFNSTTGGDAVTLSGSSLNFGTYGGVTGADNGSSTVVTETVGDNLISSASTFSLSSSGKNIFDITGNITVHATTSVGFRGVASTGTSTFAGLIENSAGGAVNSVFKTDSGTWTLTNSGNQIAALAVQTGSLISGANGAFGAAPLLTIGANSGTAVIVDLAGNNQTFGGLTSAAGATNSQTVTNSSATHASLLTYSNSATNESYGGKLTGTLLGLEKTGTNTYTLTGANTYGNGTTLDGGTLLANNTTGSGIGTGSLTVKNGATFGGTGSVAPTGSNSISVASGGSIFAGNGGSTGALTINVGGTSGNVNFASGSNLVFSLGAGNASNVLNFDDYAAGAVQFNGTVNLDLENEQIGTYTLLQLYTNTGTNLYTGSFDTSNLMADDSAGYSSTVTYNGDGLVQLTVETAPEPKPIFLLMAGIAAFVLTSRVSRLARF